VVVVTSSSFVACCFGCYQSFVIVVYIIHLLLDIGFDFVGNFVGSFVVAFVKLD